METPAPKKLNTKTILIILGALLVICILCVIAGSVFSRSTTAVQTAIANTQSAWTPIPTQTAYPTYTFVPAVIVTKIVTITFTPTPLYTPTITPTPPPPTVTPDIAQTSTAEAFAKLTADKEDGIYLVNVDIAPGIWRSTGTGGSCYWQTSTKTGDIIDNHFGMSGGTTYISASAFSVTFQDCGIFTYLGPP